MPPITTTIIGPCTLYLGDSLQLLAEGYFDKIDALVADPPYGINFVHGGGGHGFLSSMSAEKLRKKSKPIFGDDQPFDPRPWSDKFYPAKQIALFGADYYKTRLPDGGRFIAWDKSCGMGPPTVFSDVEFIWSNRKNARNIVRHLWMGVLRAGEGSSRKGKTRPHVSAKPVEVMAWLIENIRIGVGKTVLDPYMGSGSTGVACIMCGRKFVGCEIDEENYNIAVARITEAWAEANPP